MTDPTGGSLQVEWVIGHSKDYLVLVEPEHGISALVCSLVTEL